MAHFWPSQAHFWVKIMISSVQDWIQADFEESKTAVAEGTGYRVQVLELCDRHQLDNAERCRSVELGSFERSSIAEVTTRSRAVAPISGCQEDVILTAE